MEPTHLRVREAAAYLGMSWHTLNDWRHRGGGPIYLKFGRSVLYAITDLDAWKEGCRRQATHVPARSAVKP